MFCAIGNVEQRKTLEAFYKENLNYLLDIACSRLHNTSDSEDAVQTAFQEVIRDPDNFFKIPPEHRGGYMTAVVRNVSAVCSEQKQRSRMKRSMKISNVEMFGNLNKNNPVNLVYSTKMLFFKKNF